MTKYIFVFNWICTHKAAWKFGRRRNDVRRVDLTFCTWNERRVKTKTKIMQSALTSRLQFVNDWNVCGTTDNKLCALRLVEYKKTHEQTRDGRCLDGRIQVRVRTLRLLKKKKKIYKQSGRRRRRRRLFRRRTWFVIIVITVWCGTRTVASRFRCSSYAPWILITVRVMPEKKTVVAGFVASVAINVDGRPPRQPTHETNTTGT